MATQRLVQTYNISASLTAHQTLVQSYAVFATPVKQYLKLSQSYTSQSSQYATQKFSQGWEVNSSIPQTQKFQARWNSNGTYSLEFTAPLNVVWATECNIPLWANVAIAYTFPVNAVEFTTCDFPIGVTAATEFVVPVNFTVSASTDIPVFLQQQYGLECAIPVRLLPHDELSKTLDCPIARCVSTSLDILVFMRTQLGLELICPVRMLPHDMMAVEFSAPIGVRVSRELIAPVHLSQQLGIECTFPFGVSYPLYKVLDVPVVLSSTNQFAMEFIAPFRMIGKLLSFPPAAKIAVVSVLTQAQSLPPAVQTRVDALLNTLDSTPQTVSPDLQTEMVDVLQLLDPPTYPAANAALAYVNSMSDALTISNNIYLLHNGKRLEILDFTLRQDIGMYCFIGSINLPDIAAYKASNVMDLITLVIDDNRFSSRYELLITDKSYSRSGVDAPKLLINVASPTYYLEQQRITTYIPRINARAACELIAQQTIDWQILDWVIPDGILNFDGCTLIEAIRTIIKQLAVVQTNADGTLRVQYRHPVSPTKWDYATPAYTLYDNVHNLSYSEGYRWHSAMYNAVIIADATPSADDPKGEITYDLEFVEDKDDKLGSGVLRIYSSSPREVSGVQVVHTGDKSIQLGQCYPTQVEITERVEFKANKTTVQRQISGLLKVDYKSVDLGQIVVSADGKTLTTDNRGDYAGYSLCELTYTTECYVCAVTLTKAFDTPQPTQFLVV
ncbi:MAG: hypothetical protein PHP00_06930 [Thiotrichaceae bacterium]|nr:hypothetical protein [Thiotrichaceae bacterium]